MIPAAHIIEWTESAPWLTSKMVEQDLIICRALIAIYSDIFLAKHLAFRGGTALHKLYIHPQPRYSEDIDLVQVHPGPIRETINHLREALSWLGEPVVKQKKNNNTLLFRTLPTETDSGEIHLKVEINCKEHFSVFPMTQIPFEVNNHWFSGQCEVLTYELNELIGTKLRALYQRLKGRDLFDLHIALRSGQVEPGQVIEAYKQYLHFVTPHLPTYKEFVINMEGKMTDADFLGDTTGLLSHKVKYNPYEAWKEVHDKLIVKLMK